MFSVQWLKRFSRIFCLLAFFQFTHGHLLSCKVCVVPWREEALGDTSLHAGLPISRSNWLAELVCFFLPASAVSTCPVVAREVSTFSLRRTRIFLCLGAFRLHLFRACAPRCSGELDQSLNSSWAFSGLCRNMHVYSRLMQIVFVTVRVGILGLGFRLCECHWDICPFLF